MSTVSDLAKVSKQQGIAAAVALALLGAVLYMSKMQFRASEANGQDINALATSVDALGDLVISSCGASTVEVQKFEEAKRARVELKAKR